MFATSGSTEYLIELLGNADQSRAHRAWTDALLYDTRADKREFLGHLGGDDVARHDGHLRVRSAYLVQEVDECLSLAVGDTDAGILDRITRLLLDTAEHAVVGRVDSHRMERSRLEREVEDKREQFYIPVILVQRHREFLPGQRGGYLEGAGGI